MAEYTKRTGRNDEIVTFFYAIFGHRIHQGVEQRQAKKEACDAVSLRYGVSKGRLLNIISEKNNSHKVNFSAFRQNILSLIDDLRSANDEIGAVMERNQLLMSLLKDCLEDADR